MTNRSAILDQLATLALSQKTVAATPAWVMPSAKAGERVAKLVFPLAVDGVVFNGLTLELVVPLCRQNEFENLRALLFAHVAGKRWHLGRIEFAPCCPPHRNEMWAPPGLPPMIQGDEAHAHLFADNCVCPKGEAAFSPTSDLPVARKIKTSHSHHEICSLIEQHYLIDGFWFEEDIPWERALPF